VRVPASQGQLIVGDALQGGKVGFVEETSH
jgi:hypothetical protein